MDLSETGTEIAAAVTPPPTPWRMSGRLHVALHRVEGAAAPPLPAGISAILPGHRVVTLVRYLEGTLRYDELIIARLTRRGLRTGIFVDHIWVDSRPSVAGGRLIWGLPKELAEFTWSGDRVSVRDREGDIAALSVDQRPARSPEISFVAPGFGVRDDDLLLSRGSMRARLRSGSLRVEAWSPRFGTLARRRFALDATPFHLTIGDARVLT